MSFSFCLKGKWHIFLICHKDGSSCFFSAQIPVEQAFIEDTTFEEKTQLSPEKMQLSDPKAQQSAFSEDW